MGFCASMQTIDPLLKFLWEIIKKDRIVYDEPLKKVTIGTHYGVVIKIKTLFLLLTMNKKAWKHCNNAQELQ